jgi:hypothetical protein
VRLLAEEGYRNMFGGKDPNSGLISELADSPSTNSGLISELADNVPVQTPT